MSAESKLFKNVDYKELKFLKPYLAAVERKKRNALFWLGLLTRISILCQITNL
ncbi:hypothetical protein J2Z65_003664 [Paenibacillus aceris]|uniref:Uncharacterized protein n=1 Tax=Paenibacillus aceris TaxID=869555 RepID=A0ABS4I0J3_9BACL|nr:hypothetical protein [Paenibacillus aceris]